MIHFFSITKWKTMMDPELKLWTNYPDLFWVATTKTGKVVGSIAYKHIDSDTVDMHRFCVDVEFQKSGIGQQLLQTLLDTARENGYSTVTCYTSIANLGSRKLYEKNEFVLLRTTNLKLHPCFTYLTGLKEEEYELRMK